VDLNSKRHAMMDLMRVQSGNIGFDYRIFDRAELSDMLPGIRARGERGGVDADDGHTNPSTPRKVHLQKTGAIIFRIAP
jgi:hypothetical protein